MTKSDKHEKECAKIREANNTILDDFEVWLRSKGLGENTVMKHSNNIDFFVNEYLLYEGTVEAKDGISSVDMFLGYWFIRKAMWSSPSSIKENASSLKKFYEFMVVKGYIEQRALDYLKLTVKDNMPQWLERVRRYNDPDITDMSEVWGYK
jgi:site-specific recombinase XerD